MELKTSHFKQLTLLAIIFDSLLLSSCRTMKNVSEGVSIVSDTINVFEQSITIDTTDIVIPFQRDSLVSADSVSVVQTDFAISKAKLTKDGKIVHTIENKPTRTKAVISTDTTTHKKKIWHKSALHTESETTQERGLPFDKFYLSLILFAFASVFIIRRLYK